MATENLKLRKDLIGTGLKFPFEIHARTGGAKPQSSTTTSESFERINQSIQQILGTNVGERMPNRAFGCLSGDTMIPLLNGESVRLDSLIDKPVWFYGCRNNEIVPAFSKGAVFSGEKEVIRVYLDNNKFIDCTPDHLFQMRNGEYRPAIELKENDSLMPLYKKKINGYEAVYNPITGKYKHTHRIVAKFFDKNLKHDETVHHNNLDKLNNSPDNLLIFEDNISHFRFHLENFPEEKNKGIRKFWAGKTDKKRRDKEIIRRTELIQAHNKKYNEDKEYRKSCYDKKITPEYLEKLSKNTKNNWIKGVFKDISSKNSKAMKENWKNNREFLMLVAKKNGLKQLGKEKILSDKGKETLRIVGKTIGIKNLNKWQKSEECKKHITALGKANLKPVTKEQILEYSKQFASFERLEKIYEKFNISRASLKRRVKISEITGDLRLNNHKITKIEFLNKKIKTYDLANSTTQNFATDAGVFVHNSRITSLIFEPNDAILMGMAERYVEEALERWEKRIDVNDVTCEKYEALGILFINITYKIITSQQQGNMVYPLYLERKALG